MYPGEVECVPIAKSIPSRGYSKPGSYRPGLAVRRTLLTNYDAWLDFPILAGAFANAVIGAITIFEIIRTRVVIISVFEERLQRPGDHLPDR
jgi:hypothetical protein